jgi:uncharacterized protein YdcH (DUF465 family)
MKQKQKQKSPLRQRTFPNRATNMPVTVGIIEEFREEIKSHLRVHDRKFESLDHRFESLEQRFGSLEQKTESFRCEVLVEVRRTRMLVEEQNNKNNIVLDGLSSLFGRQERVEGRVDEIEHTIATFKRGSR